MKRVIRVLLLVLLLGALAAGGYWIYQNQFASATTTEDGTYTQVVTAEEGSLTASFSVVGQLEAVQSADLTFEQMSGTAKVLSLATATGQRVTAGQVLATIDATPYQQALDEANSALQAAEETLSELQTPPTDLEIAQADMAVARAQVELQAAQQSLDELLNPDIDSLESAVTSARLALAQARADLLALEQDTTSDEQIAALREADADAWAIYSDIAAKNHSESDEVYHDELMLRHNQMMDAQDALVIAEVKARLSLQQAEVSIRKSQQTLAEAQEALSEARSGGDERAQAQVRLAVRQAEASLEAAQLDRAELDEAADATAVASAQAQVDKQRLAVSEAEAALAGTELVAPFDGTILETHVSVGDPVASNSSIVTLANLGSLQVAASVDETTIRQVTAGQKASISFDAYPNQTFAGEVLSVPLYGSLQGGVTVYDVPLSLAGAEALNLLVGMTANVEIETGYASDALLVPTLALQKVSGSYQVSVPNTLDPEGEPETVPVQIGLSNGTYTQIVKGLIAGDQVIVQLESTQSAGNFLGGSSGVFSNMFRFGSRR
jgi:RND family efflux transporter MFP subunit